MLSGMAQVRADSPATGLTPTGDLSAYSDYVARGLSYSAGRYSLQAHGELDSSSGAYAGLYVIHNAQIIDKQTVEMDPYIGYLRQFGPWSLDIGTTAWLYPDGRFDVSRNRYNSLEATVDVTYEVFGVKLWYDLKDYWGLDRGSSQDYGLPSSGASQGSLYVDSHLTVPLPYGITLRAHLGRQYIREFSELDYTDWLLGVEEGFAKHFALGLSYTGTTADESLWILPSGLKLGATKWTAYLTWTLQ